MAGTKSAIGMDSFQTCGLRGEEWGLFSELKGHMCRMPAKLSRCLLECLSRPLVGIVVRKCWACAPPALLVVSVAKSGQVRKVGLSALGSRVCVCLLSCQVRDFVCSSSLGTYSFFLELLWYENLLKFIKVSKIGRDKTTSSKGKMKTDR